jgi:3-phosphoshikimate 1-carboxyvinyltransferase
VRVAGSVRPPGDKSITHRVLMLASLLPGMSALRGALTSADTRATARCLRGLGVEVGPMRASLLWVRGRPWRAPDATLHCGNSGTTARLLLGLLAAHRFEARLTGDQSLRRRPMRRVTEPLMRMGAQVVEEQGSGLPLRIRGGGLSGLTWDMPVASAQVKTALVFAGLAGGVRVAVREPVRSRDHTERMLGALHAPLRTEDGWLIIDAAPEWLAACPALEWQVAGDASSAAFLVAAALLAQQGELRVREVGLNPTRTGYLDVLARMGASVTQEGVRDVCGEPVGDLIVRPANLRGTTVPGDAVPSLIDEVPVLAVLASRAAGETVFESVGELRVKESDRLGLLAANLRAVGGRAEVVGDALHVEGSDRPPRGRVETAGDHRLAMAFAVLGRVRGARITLSEDASPAVSYPGFFTALHGITGHAR